MLTLAGRRHDSLRHARARGKLPLSGAFRLPRLGGSSTEKRGLRLTKYGHLPGAASAFALDARGAGVD